MRFIHTADWHLGRLFHGVHLTDDQRYALLQLVDLVRDAKPDAVLVAGDIYDRAIPPPEAVELLDEILCKIVLEAKVPVVLIAGNHDSPHRLNFASRLFRDNRLYVTGQMPAVCKPVTFSDAWGDVRIYPVPYAEPATVREALGDGSELCVCHDTAMREVCARIRAAHDDGGRSILVGHAFVMGGAECESERPLSVGGAGTVAAGHFAGFDYVALGHLHAPQTIWNGEKREASNEKREGSSTSTAVESDRGASPVSHSRTTHVRYSGSLLKYSFDEADQSKGVYVVEMDGDGRCAVETIRLTPKRDVRRVSGTMADLLTEGGDGKSRDDYVEVTILDDGPVIDPVGRLRQVYPNVMQIKRPERAGGPVAADRIDVRGKTAVELFSSFFKHVRGDELSADQEVALRGVVDELARKEREADGGKTTRAVEQVGA
ncbi:MAG TPA: exonuclease SbcCD subunit D [Tepidisphaeraceae bacterium]|nr:exonuclease SbcCD subunit D [Tepidisphaeraceae bacterium]